MSARLLIREQFKPGSVSGPSSAGQSTAFQLKLQPGRLIKAKPKCLVCGCEVRVRFVAACICVRVMDERRPVPSRAVTQVGPLETNLGSWLQTRGLQAFNIKWEEECVKGFRVRRAPF